MNIRTLIAVVVSMFVLCQQAHAQNEETPEQVESTELEGTWELMSEVSNGEPGSQWRFEGNRSYYRGSEDKNWTPVGTFSMDPSAMPAEIDFVSRRRCGGETNQLGIYELDDDLLRICFGIPGEIEPESRPDVFESPQGSNDVTMLIVLRRVTEEESE